MRVLTLVNGDCGGGDLEDTGEESGTTDCSSSFRKRGTGNRLKLDHQLSHCTGIDGTYSNDIALLVCLFSVEESVYQQELED
jgi:hypothetical protein